MLPSKSQILILTVMSAENILTLHLAGVINAIFLRVSGEPLDLIAWPTYQVTGSEDCHDFDTHRVGVPRALTHTTMLIVAGAGLPLRANSHANDRMKVRSYNARYSADPDDVGALDRCVRTMIPSGGFFAQIAGHRVGYVLPFIVRSSVAV